MLAALPAAQVRALFPGPDAFVTRNEAGPRSISALRRLLADVRRTGHAVEDGEVTPGFASVAVAVTFPCPAGSAAPLVASSLVGEVARTARAITARIGG